MDDKSVIGFNRLYEFGPFRLNAAEHTLLKDGAAVPLTGKVLDLLLILVESAGHLKTREELIEALWPRTIVEEHSLTSYISMLRKALGDEGEVSRYIETVRGRGYRFVAPVKVEEIASAQPAENSGEIDRGRETEGVGAAHGRDRAQPGAWSRAWRAPTGVWFAVAAAAIVVIAGALIWRFVPFGPAGKGSTTPVIAVLPFENLSANPANAWFAAGIQDTILSKLAEVGKLRVISRTSTKRYPSHPSDLKGVAAQLGATAILEGSVQKSGDKVLINVQLIDAKSDEHIWAHVYIRSLTNVFTVETDVATGVASALQVELLPAKAASLASAPTQDPQAYLLFLKANYYADRIIQHDNVENFAEAANRAISLFHQTVAHDPHFALAWARLSLLESFLYWHKFRPSIKEAKDAARRALALAPKLPQAHLAMGFVEYFGLLNYTSALDQFKRALAGLPNNADVIEAIAVAHRRQGKWQQALSGMQRAMKLDPRNPRRYFPIGYTLMALRNYSQARQQFARTLALDPHNYDAKAMNLMILFLAGNPLQQIQQELTKSYAPHIERGLILTLKFWATRLNRQPKIALAAIAKAPDWIAAPNAFGREPTSLLRAHAWALLGNQARARQAYQKALKLLRDALHGRPKDASLWSFFGLAEAGLGQKREAIQAGRKATTLVSVSKDAIDGPSFLLSLAKIYVLTGESEQAIKLLRRLLAMPAGLFISVPLLKRDHIWDPLRKNPQFQKLLKEYGHKKAPVPESESVSG